MLLSAWGLYDAWLAPFLCWLAVAMAYVDASTSPLDLRQGESTTISVSRRTDRQATTA